MPTSWLGRAWGWRNRLNATLILLIIAGLIAFLGIAVISNYKAAGDAVASLNQARVLTARRIDKLNGEIDALSAQNAQAARQRGLLIAEVQALTAQLRALGVSPVVTTPAASRTAAPAPAVTSTSPRPSATAHPRRTSHPTPSRQPTSRPSPKPTATPCLTNLLHCLATKIP